MADDLESVLRLEGDSSGAEKATEKVNKELASLQKSADANTQKFKALGAEINNSLGNRASQSLKDAQRNTEGLRKETDAAIKAVERYDSAFKKVSERVSVFGDVESGLSATSGLLGSVSPEASGALNVVRDLTALNEELPRFGVGIKEIGTRIAESGGVLGSVASAAQGLIPGLSASAAGFAAVAAAALPIVAIGAAAAIAIASVTSALEAQREAARAAAETTIEGLNAEQQARFLADRQRFDDLQKRIDAEREAAIVGASQLNAYREEVERLNEVFKNFNTQGADAGFSNRQQIVDEIGRLNEELKTLQPEVANAQTRLQSMTDVQAEYADEIAASEQATKEAAAAETDLSGARDKALTTIAALKQQQDELTAAYERQAEATIANRQLQDARAAEDESITKTRAQEDLNRALEEQAQAHQKNLENITKRGSDAIADAYKALADRQQQASKAIADVQAQYQKESLKAEYEFNKERSRAQRDFLKEQKRAFEDFKKSQAASILDNDVLSFLEGQDAFKTDRRRGREDRRDQRSDNRQDFDDEQRERLAAAQERIAEIQAELAEFQAATALKIAAIKEQTSIDLAEAQRVYEEKLAKDAALREIQAQRDQEDSDLRAARQQQDREREDNAAAAALQANLDRIESRKQTEIDALEAVGGKAAELRAAESIALDTLLLKIRNINSALTQSQPTAGAVPLPTGSAPHVPSPDSKEFYEDPGQGPAGQGGGGGFGAGFSGVSSVGSGGRRGGGGLTINVQPRVMSMGGVEFVLKEDFDALIETIKAALSEKEVNL